MDLNNSPQNLVSLALSYTGVVLLDADKINIKTINNAHYLSIVSA